MTVLAIILALTSALSLGVLIWIIVLWRRAVKCADNAAVESTRALVESFENTARAIESRVLARQENVDAAVAEYRARLKARDPK